MSKVLRGISGRDGRDGVDGEKGKSALELALASGQVKDAKEFFGLLIGQHKLTDGDGIYQAACAAGFEGSFEKLIELIQGPRGDQGPQGKDGKSAYQVAVEQGFSGNVQEWLKSLKGKDGKDGKDGERGPRGEKGEKGDKGEPGKTIYLGGGGGGGTPTPGGAVDSVNGQTGVVVLDAGDVGADPAGSAAAAQAAAIAAAATDATTKAGAAETNAKSYADTLVVGLLDDRGNYDASGNTFPASGGSGSAGAIKKGDLWTISVAGTLGGHAVTAGDVVRALVDTPAQTDANWAISENNFGYVAENSANKVTSISGASTDVQYPSAKLLFDQLALKQAGDATLTAFGALTIAANSLTIGTGADAFSQTTFAANTFPARASTGNLVAKTITDDGLTFLAAANQAAMRAAIGAGTGSGDATLAGTNTWTAQNTFAIGTITTSKPHTISQTWNDGAVTFTGWLLDLTSTASAAASLAMDVKVGGATVFKVAKDGAITGLGIACGSSPGATALGSFNSYNAGVEKAAMNTTGFRTFDTGLLRWTNSANSQTGTTDTTIGRAGANSIVVAGASAAAGAVTSRTELNKEVTGIANATATDVLTLTIPNGAHSGQVYIELCGQLGAGGAVGACEATATNCYTVTFTRTAGVNAVAAISAASGSGAVAVAGAATVTCTATLSAVSGAVGATNTFTIKATISRSGGASANHTCLVYAKLMNKNATGATIA